MLLSCVLGVLGLRVAPKGFAPFGTFPIRPISAKSLRCTSSPAGVCFRAAERRRHSSSAVISLGAVWRWAAPPSSRGASRTRRAVFCAPKLRKKRVRNGTSATTATPAAPATVGVAPTSAS